MRPFACVALALLAVLLAVPAAGEQAPETAKDLLIKTLPGIVVDTKPREVRLEGLVCLQKGALELFVCSARTREHESVIVVKAKPSHVTFALSLLDLAPGKPGFTTEGGAFSPPAGEVLEITARFTRDGKAVEIPAWRLLRLSGAHEGLDRPIDWVYVGRPEPAALVAADREGTVVCLSNFVEAVIDVPFESTSVNANLLYEANPDVVPPPGTAVELIIRPAGRRVEPVKVEIEVILKKGQPLELDGKPTELDAFRDAVNSAPTAIRTAVLKADADERFGRVMEVQDILRNALMEVRLAVRKAVPVEPKRTEPPAPLTLIVTADDKVRVGEMCLPVEEFRQKAAELLKGAERVTLTVEPKAAMRTVAEVLAAARDQGAQVTLTHAAPSQEGPAPK